MSAYEIATQIGHEYTNFLCASVGAPINKLEEFSILVDWHNAINDAIDAALAARDWAADTEFCDMREECARYLDLNKLLH